VYSEVDLYRMRFEYNVETVSMERNHERESSQWYDKELKSESISRINVLLHHYENNLRSLLSSETYHSDRTRLFSEKPGCHEDEILENLETKNSNCRERRAPVIDEMNVKISNE